MAHRDQDRPHPPRRSSGSAVALFWRLFSRFAGRYWLRLSLGILTGLLMGGSVSVILRIMDFGLNVFENLNGPGHDATTPNAIVRMAPASPRTQPTTNAAPGAPMTTTPPTPSLAPAAVPEPTHPRPAQRNIDRYLDSAEALAAKFGYDLRINRDGAISLQLLVGIIALMFTLFLAKALCEFVTKYCLGWVGARIVTDIRIALFTRIQSQSVAFFDHHDVGQLIARCTNDTGVVEKSVSTSVAELFTAPLMIVASFQFIIVKAMAMNLFTQSIWLILAIPGCIVPVYMLSRYLRRYQKRLLAGIAVLVARMQENFSGIRVVKAFNCERSEAERFTHESNRYFRSVRKALLAATFMQPIMQLVMLTVGALFLVVCYRYGITLASLATLAFAAQEAYRPIKELAKINNDLQKSAAACERILDLLNADTGLPVSQPAATPTAFHSTLDFSHVSFRYLPDGPDIIADFNLTIRRGQLVAIIGPTGSGKSTIAHLLCRFYDPTQGSIAIDGNDLRAIDNHALRSLVGVVAQESFLFNDTIASNIAFGSPNATPEQIRQAAQQANALDFILDKPDQFDTCVGERGSLLSGGQRQRLSIARALLRNPPILILDEATSALDSKTERLVQEAFDKLMADRTVIAIAHRLSTIINADLILVCDHGRIVEQGTHHQLYQLNGTYRKLYDIQFQTQEHA